MYPTLLERGPYVSCSLELRVQCCAIANTVEHPQNVAPPCTTLEWRNTFATGVCILRGAHTILLHRNKMSETTRLPHNPLYTLYIYWSIRIYASVVYTKPCKHVYIVHATVNKHINRLACDGLCEWNERGLVVLLGRSVCAELEPANWISRRKTYVRWARTQWRPNRRDAWHH